MVHTIKLLDQDAALVFRQLGSMEWYIPTQEYRNEKDDPYVHTLLVGAIKVLMEHDPKWKNDTIARAEGVLAKIQGTDVTERAN